MLHAKSAGRVTLKRNRLIGPVVKAVHSGAADPASIPALSVDLSLGRVTPVATTLPGVWRYRVSARAGRPGVRIL